MSSEAPCRLHLFASVSELLCETLQSVNVCFKKRTTQRRASGSCDYGVRVQANAQRSLGGANKYLLLLQSHLTPGMNADSL